MSLLAEDTSLMSSTKSFCEALASQDEFKKLHTHVEAFLTDDEARLQYQSVHESGEALNDKQRSGVELTDAEINEFEQAREQLLQNSVVTNFMDAQRELQTVQQTISKYVGLTLELGHAPTDEDLAAAAAQESGCCGGSGGGGCGC
ncbi:YlbF family regulator [Rubritalea marina]|uniref:YlbF family regulator n=1 Tax=Rubritalea marina TaxID=361055 RepID=UPI00036D76E7|nr:YlbF family regulator [Rubritalea marina]